MPKQLLRPGWVLTHLVVIAIAVSFISLGLWQVRRHHEQVEENTRVEAQLASSPAALEDALASPDIDLLPVRATGTFEADEQLQLAPRSRNERPGFEVLAPLRLDDGRALLVNRGWMPLDSELPAPPAGEVTVTGRLRTPFDSRQVLTDDAGTITLVSSVDTDVLAEQVDDLITVGWLEVVDEQAREQGVLPRPAEPPVLEAGPHLNYAAQWFAFTIIGLIGYPLLLRRRLADADRESVDRAGASRTDHALQTK
ncbi:SURF1 family protein [Euzebya rosea]|uniref:SURF1 family protein n=1 Tax=Euzebya rosea TaxID=2052804 RepID=UPI000D3E76C1|nr:SURF1 family protein [Euzebya rosea]